MKIGMVIIVNACIWGLVIVACSLALKGTGQYENIQNVLAGGAGASMLVVFLGGRRVSKKGSDDAK